MRPVDDACTGVRSTAPIAEPNASAGEEEEDHEEEWNSGVTRERALLGAVFVLAAVAFLYFVLPQLAGLHDTWRRLEKGEVSWLAIALGFQVLAMASYVLIFQGIHVPPGSPITYRESYLITMAGLAATRLFAAGGAGGVALTAWALRRSGMKRKEVAERMIAFLVLLYLIYAIAMLVAGVGLFSGILPGGGPASVTLAPAIVSAILIGVMLAVAYVPEDLERRFGRVRVRSGRLARMLHAAATAPARVSGGTRFALHKIRHPEKAMIGAVTWWAFNIAVLWASFKAFGASPPIGVLVMGYFVGLLGNLLPLPGGIGGVDGGMIGAFAALGVDGGLALVAVLAYRAFAFWLPTLPGAIAYLQLRRTVARWKQERADGLRATA